VLIACLAVHDKEARDGVFVRYLRLIKKGATDERNFVKKAVNWALRQIGKRNLALREKAIAAAEQIQKIDSRSARWIAADALRELRNPKTEARMRAKANARLGEGVFGGAGVLPEGEKGTIRISHKSLLKSWLPLDRMRQLRRGS
jgi:hypothetical protein